MSRALQPVTIDGMEFDASVEFDALIDETLSLHSNIPTYPVERGFEVSDSIILQARTLDMTIYVTNTPVTWVERHRTDQARVEDVVDRLKEIYYTKKLVTVTTTDDTYENMGIISIELTKALETGTSREIPIHFQEVRVTDQKTTTIPASYGRSGTTGANAGAANTTSRPAGSGGSSSGGGGGGSGGGGSSGSGSNGSVLHGAARAAGLIR